MFRAVVQALAAVFLILPCVSAGAQTPASASELQTNISRLSALDYPVRMNAARMIRRLPAAEAVPALSAAVAKHPDEFVRYRAFIVLSSFNDKGTGTLVRGLLTDSNDRLREAAYKWLEAHPDPALLPTILNAVQSEQAEFVRPAVIGALAALGDDMRAQRVLLAEINRGLDFFREAVIDALGRRRATYALDPIAAVSKLPGPLQDDAVIALGRIGGPGAIAALGALATGAPAPNLALTLQAAQCLAGQRCEAAIKTISDAVSVPTASAAILRAGMSGLTAMAAGGNEAAALALVTVADRGGVVREQAAVGIGTMAVSVPDRTLAWLDRAPAQTREKAIALLKDGFDDLEEDFREEQFFAAARAAYWKAGDGSETRSLAALLIQRLEF